MVLTEINFTCIKLYILTCENRETLSQRKIARKWIIPLSPGQFSISRHFILWEIYTKVILVVTPTPLSRIGNSEGNLKNCIQGGFTLDIFHISGLILEILYYSEVMRLFFFEVFDNRIISVFDAKRVLLFKNILMFYRGHSNAMLGNRDSEMKLFLEFV